MKSKKFLRLMTSGLSLLIGAFIGIFFLGNNNLVKAGAPLLGSGTVGDPYQISECSDLVLIQNNLSANYLLTADFSCISITNWSPMGTFTGVLDGANHTISDIVNTGYREHNGLFSYISGATVKDLTISGISFPQEGWAFAGGLVGQIDSDETHITVIQNVHTSGTIWGGFYTGGLIGLVNGVYTTIDNCSANVEVHGAEHVGGLIGKTESPVTNSHADGAVFGQDYYANTGGLIGTTLHSVSDSYATGAVRGENLVGGLIGYQETSANLSVNNCYATGHVTGGHNDADPRGNTVGGLIGYSRGPVTNSHATGNVINLNPYSNDGYGIGGLIGTSQDNTIIDSCYATGTVDGNFSVGGLIGAAYNMVNISNSFATGNIGTIMSTGTRVGGFVGTSAAHITNSYAMGNVTGSSEVGGFAGGHGWGGSTLTYSFSKGLVTGTSTVGGMVGYSEGGISNSYYDSDTSGRSDNNGRGIPKTTAQMKTQSTFVGWNFSTIWHIDTLNDGYPYTTVATGGLSSNSTVSSLTYTVSANGTANEIISDVPVGVDKTTFLAALTKNNPNQVWDDTNISDPLFSGNTLLVTAEDGVTTTTYFIVFVFSGLGEGTALSPFEITTCEQFHEMQNNLSSNYIVQNYIDCYDYIWTPIGSNPGVPFRGVLDGNDQTIGDIIFGTNDGGSFAGVFGDIESATIKDITFLYIDINTPNYSMVGGLAGAMDLANPAGTSIIDNVDVSGTVIGGSMTGGLIGFADSYNTVIRNSTTNVTLTGTEMTGGLVGQNYSSIDGCSATGNVNGGYRTGGLVGSAWNNYAGVTTYITQSHYIGAVVATGSRSGGLVGDSAVRITNSDSKGSVNVTGDYAGGLVGFQYAGATGFNYLLSESSVYATGNNVGGLFGNLTQSSLTNSYATGNTTGLGGYVGGLIGNHYMISSDEYTLTNVYATGDVTGGGYGYIGGLVGSASVPISNAYSLGHITGAVNYIGGIAGVAYSSVDTSHALGPVDASGSYIGGLVGGAYGDITNSYAEGNVTATGDGDTYNVGGLVGAAFTKVTSSHATGTVIANGADPDGRKNVGGLIGVAYTTSPIADSYSLGEVFANQGKYVGGLIGYHVGTGIERSFAIGNVEGNINVGGLVGGSIGTTIDTFSIGNVSGSDKVGGLFGETFSLNSISNSYSKGLVTGTTNTGGLVGLAGEDTTLSLAYYDTQTSGQSDTGKGDPKTTAEMTTQSTYTGWNFSTVWLMDSGINNGYPYQDGLPVNLSNNATVTGFIYDISANGTSNETISGVLYGVSKADFLAGLTKGEINQTWNDSNINDPVVTGNTLVVTAQDGVTVVTYTISVDIQRVLSKFDINIGTAGSYPDKFAYIGDTLYFTSDDGIHGNELWKSIATTGETVLVKDIEAGANGSYPNEIINVNGVLYFTASDSVNGYGLWKSDGTTDGTTLVKGGIEMSYPLNVNGTLYFWADVSPYGKELWKSDGTEAGTVLVKDITVGTGSTNSGGFYAVARNSIYIFLINEQLWISDGSEAGTVMLKSYDAAAGTPVNINGNVFFIANDTTDGGELWKTDGTVGGTVRVKDIIPGTTGSWPSNLINFKGSLYFWAMNSSWENELWKSDGTSEGTIKVDNATAYSIDSSVSPVVSGGKIYFAADDSDWMLGTELWATNGLPGGTRMVKDIDVDSYTGSDIEQLADVNGILYFSAHDNSEGGYNQELWRSNGSAEGTVMVENIEPASGDGSYPEHLINVNNTLFFSAWTNNEGTELYRYGAEIEVPNSTLSALDISNCVLDPVFDSATLSYSCTIDSTLGSVQITPTTTKPTSTLTINGKLATSGSAFIQNIKPLENTITIIVTDADGITTSTYTITITKPTIIGASYYEYLSNVDFGTTQILEKPYLSVIDSDNNIVIGGFIQGAEGYGPVDLDPGPGVAMSPEGGCGFVMKLNSSREFMWVKYFDFSFWAIDVDTSNNIYITGYITGNADLDPGDGIVKVIAPNGGGNYQSGFIVKLNPSGEYLWGRADSFPEGEVGLWNLDETVDNSCPDGKDACDSSGMGNNATLYGNAPIVNTTNGRGRDFDGATGTYLDLGRLSVFTPSDMTIEAFIKKEGDCGVFNHCSIVSMGSDSNTGYNFSVKDGHLQLKINDGGYYGTSLINSVATINNDTWYYVAVTLSKNHYNVNNTSEAKLYINGVLDSSSTIDAAIYSYGFNSFKIGNGQGGNDLPFNGVIDGVRFSNVIRDATYFSNMSAKYFAGTGSDLGSYVSPTFDSIGGELQDDLAIDTSGNIYFNFLDNSDKSSTYPPTKYVKLDSDGNEVWTKLFDQIDNDTYFDIDASVIDNAGNIVLTGYIYGGRVDFDPGAGVDAKGPVGGVTGYFIIKLDSDGNYQWGEIVNATTGSFVWSSKFLEVDSQNNIVIFASFRGTADFDPGVGEAIETSVNSNSINNFVLKLNSNGNYIWHRVIKGAMMSNQELLGLGINNDDNIFFSMRTEADTLTIGTSEFDVPNLSGYDTVLVEMDSTGQYVYSRFFLVDTESHIEANQIMFDSNDDMYFTGYYDMSVDFNLDETSVNRSLYTTPPDSNMFIVKYVKLNSGVAPQVLNVIINGGSDITLNPGSTKNILVTGQVTDAEGNSDISSVSTKLYYSAVSGAENCLLNDSNCYEVSCTKSNCSGNSCDVSCSVDLEYYATPSDINSSNPSAYWSAYLTATDNSNLSASEYSAENSPDVLSQMSFTLDKSSISYGTVFPGNNTGATNQEIILTNNGNVNFDTELYGTNMCKDFPTCSGSMVRIAPTQQKFNMSTFTYSSEGNALQASATAYQFNSEVYPNNIKSIYWGIAIPSIIGSGAHSGEVYINAINDF